MLKSQFFFHLYILMKVIVSYVIIRYLTRGIFLCAVSHLIQTLLLHYITLHYVFAILLSALKHSLMKACKTLKMTLDNY